MNQREANLFDVLYARRSIRRYEAGREVEREKIEKLLRAAMAAPSACNLQPWEFIVVTGWGDVKALSGCLGRWRYDAPAAMVVCGNTSYIPWENDAGFIDCSAAIENMLLAATAMGLGSVWIGDYDAEALRRRYEISAHVVPMGVVYFGYPAEEKPPRTQYNEEAVYWGKYDPARPHAPRTIEGQLSIP